MTRKLRFYQKEEICVVSKLLRGESDVFVGWLLLIRSQDILDSDNHYRDIINKNNSNLEVVPVKNIEFRT